MALLLGVAAAVLVLTRGSTVKTGAATVRLAKAEAGNKADVPGEGLPSSTAAAEEAYMQRAYPADDIPFSATLKAQKAFFKIAERSTNRTSFALPGQWVLWGPAKAQFPAELTFSGAPYVTSGRITALAISPVCFQDVIDPCRLWVAAAGGGIWRTNNALSTVPTWSFLSNSFATNAIGTLYVDPTDPSGNTLYAGTGEPNVSVDSEAGLGLYKTTNGGNTWTKLPDLVTALTTSSPQGPNGTYTGDAFASRAISMIAVDPTNPNTIYVASARGVRGVSSVSSGGVTGNPPTPRPPYGLFKSTDGGATFNFIWDGNGTSRGVTDVYLDPTNPSIVYASALNQGVWRSLNGGTTFALLHAKLTANDPDRASIAVTKLPSGATRMYIGEGAAGSPQARFFRSDNADTAGTFTDMTTTQNINYCTGQCWYDNVVYTPPGLPDTVYLDGSFDYSNYGFRNNGRGVLYSTDGGANWTDETWDATTNPTPANTCCQPNAVAPNGIHPDQHAIVVNPNTPTQFFDGSDGGLVRSTGSFTDISGQCATRGLSGANLTLCQQLLSRAPTQLWSMNWGLSTLQYQSLSIDPTNFNHIQGGTQDNGTFETSGVTLPQIIYGDGGQSGFSVANPALRFNTFTGQFSDTNFHNGNSTDWVIATGPIAASPEGSYFYPPVTGDPVNAQTIYQGSFSVWRTQDWGGNEAYLEANCPEFTTSGADPACGDFVKIGPVGQTNLTSAFYGTRAGGAVAAIERAPSNTGTLWAATGTGRVFVSQNGGDAAAASVTWTRIDTLSAASPGRFPTSIFVDPANPNHAWISYSGYNFNTPATPGHVFSVTYDPIGGTATWTNLDGGSGPMGDLPVTDLVYDSVKGDLYASTDFGVLRLANGSGTWTSAGTGMPMVEVAGLSIDSAHRTLYAATHGRSAWRLTLPPG